MVSMTEKPVVPVTESHEYIPDLRDAAQVMIDGVAPEGVTPSTRAEFERRLRAVVRDNQAETGQWTRLGLGGARMTLSLPRPGMIREAVAHLMSDGHGHHFAVVGEGDMLVLSEMAVECVRSAGLLE